MFSNFDVFSMMESSAKGLAVGPAPSQAVWEAVGLGRDGPQTVGTSATSAVELHKSANPAAPAVRMAQGQEPIQIEDGTEADASPVVEEGLPASKGRKRQRKAPARVQGGLEWRVAVPEDQSVPSLFLSSKLRGCAPKKG